MDSSLIGLHKKGMLKGKSLSSSRNWSARSGRGGSLSGVKTSEYTADAGYSDGSGQVPRPGSASKDLLVGVAG